MLRTEDIASELEKLGYIVKRYKRNNYYDYAIFKNVENYIDPVCNILKNKDTGAYEIFFQGYISDLKFLELLIKFMKSLMEI